MTYGITDEDLLTELEKMSDFQWLKIQQQRRRRHPKKVICITQLCSKVNKK